MATDVITIEAFRKYDCNKAAERVATASFNFLTEAGSANAYRMRWLCGGDFWVRMTWPNGTVREYGKPGPVEHRPDAVVVDVHTGLVYYQDETGHPLGEAGAVGLAAKLNGAMKPQFQTYRVFKLVPVE